MASATQSGTGVGTYGVDAFDARVTRQTTGSGAIDHDYIFDADGHLLAEHDATTGDVVREYIWIDDMPVAMVDQSSGTEQIYFIHTGQTGEPLMMTDSTKAPVWDDYLDPYGTATPLGTDTVSLDLRYPGQWLQPETGNLAQNWFSDYDASLGRYAEADPLGIDTAHNLYRYAIGNPLQYIDPRGLYDPRPLTAAERAALAEELGGGGPEDFVADFLAAATIAGGAILAELSDGQRPPPHDGGAGCPKRDDCDRQQAEEEQKCWDNYGSVFGKSDWRYHGCLQRARYRGDMCRRGQPNPPPPWSDRDIDGFPTIHEKLQ